MNNNNKWKLASCRLPFAAICLLGALTTPCSLQADVVTINYSGAYIQVGNPAIFGTVAGSFTFDNTAGTVIQATLTPDGGGEEVYNCTALPPSLTCGTFALPGGGLGLQLQFINSGFLDTLQLFVSESSLVGHVDLTPMLVGGMEGQFVDFGTVDCNALFGPGCAMSSLAFRPMVPEPSALFSLATGLVFLPLRQLARLHTRKLGLILSKNKSTY